MALWHLAVGDRVSGPHDEATILDGVRRGEVPPEALLCPPGGAEWTVLASTEPFASALRPPPPPMQVAPVAGPAPMRAPPTFPQAHAAPVAVAKTDTLAILALVLAATGVCCAVPGPIAMVLGALSYSKIEKSNGALKGKWIAIAGILIGTYGLGFLVLYAAGIIKRPAASESAPREPAPPRPHRASSVLAKAEVRCVPAGPTALSCSVSSTGSGQAKVCWDTVVECSKTRHVGRGCSGILPAGSTETRVIRDFSPPIDPTSQCEGIRVENMILE